MLVDGGLARHATEAAAAEITALVSSAATGLGFIGLIDPGSGV